MSMHGFGAWAAISILLAGCAGPAEAQGRQDRQPRQERAARNDRDAEDRARTDRRRERNRGPRNGIPGAVVINPISMGKPVSIGSVEIGSPVQVGAPFVVGHPDRDPFRPTAPPAAFATSPVGETPVPAPARRRAGTRAIPTYVFTPWFAVGPRLVAGWPVAYPEKFINRSGLPARSLETSAAPSGSQTAPQMASAETREGGTQQAYGGLTFAITPVDADVLIEGEQVGQVRDYSTGAPPLTLAAGATHRVELRSAGYRSERFDATLSPGQVIPLTGAMERTR